MDPVFWGQSIESYRCSGNSSASSSRVKEFHTLPPWRLVISNDSVLQFVEFIKCELCDSLNKTHFLHFYWCCTGNRSLLFRPPHWKLGSTICVSIASLPGKNKRDVATDVSLFPCVVSAPKKNLQSKNWKNLKNPLAPAAKSEPKRREKERISAVIVFRARRTEGRKPYFGLLSVKMLRLVAAQLSANEWAGSEYLVLLSA